MTTPHPFAHLIALGRERLARGERPVDIARDWASTVDAADDAVLQAFPVQVAGITEALDGPVVFVAAVAFLMVLRGHDRKAARRQARAT